MDGESEANPGQEEAVAAARKSVEAARTNLDDEKKNAARREWGGWLIRMRENPFLKSRMTKFLGLFAGISLQTAAAEVPEISHDRAPMASPVFDPGDESIPWMSPIEHEDKGELSLPDETVSSLVRIAGSIPRPLIETPDMPEMTADLKRQLALIAESIEDGTASPEYYARVGRPEWSIYQRSLFSNEPVQERFLELHPEYRGLNAREYLESYSAMLDLAKTEFRFSNEYRFLTENAIDLYVSEAASMEEDKALAVYKDLITNIGTNVGFRHVSTLNEKIAGALPSDHPVRVFIDASGYSELKSLLSPSRSNIVHMDQASGELRVLRRVGDQFVLLDSFPAIGGNLNTPEMTVAGKASGSEFVHVPDTVMKVAYVDRAKTSWSWHNSWVPEGAPIREKGNELQYQHPANKQWYDLTGPNAAFFPDKDGKTIRPFDGKREPMDAELIRAATHADPASGRTYVPEMWTREQIIARVSDSIEAPTEWRWNDFGSMAVRLNTGDGEKTNINIHSRPNQDPNDFLGTRTHGCFSTYGEYVKSLADEYGVGNGSTVVATTEASYNLKELLERK